MIEKSIFTISIILCLFTGKIQAQDVTVKDTMVYYRQQIDTLDLQLTNILAQRMQAARAIGAYKMNHQIGVVQSARFKEVLNGAIQRGKLQYLSEEFVRDLYNDIHKESIRQEKMLQIEMGKASNQ